MTPRRTGRASAAATELRSDVERWARRLRVSPRSVQIRRMTRKWASCSSTGRLSFSQDLLGEERAFRDVVIVHELLHLRVPNHGKLFRSLMRAHVPKWETAALGRIPSCARAR